jgi:hypothetical protein
MFADWVAEYHPTYGLALRPWLRDDVGNSKGKLK